MGGSDEGDGKGTKVYGVFGRSDGKGWVGGLFVADVKELGGRELNGEVIEDEILLPEGDKLVGGRVGGLDDGEDGKDK
jgi:hypothetical protein